MKQKVLNVNINIIFSLNILCMLRFDKYNQGVELGIVSHVSLSNCFLSISYSITLVAALSKFLNEPPGLKITWQKDDLMQEEILPAECQHFLDSQPVGPSCRFSTCQAITKALEKSLKKHIFPSLSTHTPWWLFLWGTLYTTELNT